MKYYNANFRIDKKYALELQNRKQRFIEQTKTKKQVFTTFITNYGVVENEYSLGIVDVEIGVETLF